MNDIYTEIRTAIQNIANNYGVIVKDLTVGWMGTSPIDGKSYQVDNIEIKYSKIIPVIK